MFLYYKVKRLLGPAAITVAQLFGACNLALGADSTLPRLEITDSTLTAYLADHTTKQFPVSKRNLPAGDYKLSLKRRAASFRADDRYFERRKLKKPISESDRILRGALGDLALVLTPNSYIYSAQVPTDDVPGIAVKPEVIAEIYFKLPIGTVVEVK